MDAIAVGNYLRDACDNDMQDFIERMMCRLSERELSAIKYARKDMKAKMKFRADVLERHRMAIAAEKRKRDEAEKPMRIAREFEQVCEGVFA